MKLTTRIDAADPNGKFRWCAVNEHDRMLLHFFGPKAECEAIDATFKKDGHAAFGAVRVTKKGKRIHANGVYQTLLSVELTPCVECGDPLGRIWEDEHGIRHDNKGAGGVIHVLDLKTGALAFEPDPTDPKKQVPVLAPFHGCQLRLT